MDLQTLNFKFVKVHLDPFLMLVILLSTQLVNVKYLIW